MRDLQEVSYDNGYNKAIQDVLDAIEDETKMTYTTTPTGFKVLYKETLKNVVKSLKK